MRKKIETEDISLNSQNPSAPGPDDDQLLTVPEAAQLLRIQPTSLYHFISDKRVPVVRLSARCVRFSRKALLQWIASMTETPDSDIWKQRKEK